MRMKRAVVVCLLVLCVALAGWSEEEPYGFLKSGIQGGVNLVQSIQTEIGNTAFSLGVHVHVLPLLSVRPSIWLFNYNQHRSDALAGYSDSQYTDYLMIGGRLDLLLHPLRFAKGSLYAGPSVGGYSLGITNYYTPPNSGTSSKTSRSAFLAGVVIGGEYLFDPHFGAFVDARFTYSQYSDGYQAWNTTGTATSDYTYKYNRFFFEGASIGFVAYLN